MKTKTTKLWLTSTCWIPDCEAYVLCRTAVESIERSLTPGEKLHRIKVRLTNCKYGYRGRAHWWDRDPQDRTIHWCRILVRIGKPHRFPCDVTYWKFKDMPEFRFNSYREALVAVTAHEIGHTLGYSGRKAGEMKCEMCAWDALDYYRKHQEEIDAEITRYITDMNLRQEKAERIITPDEKAQKAYMKLQAKLAQWNRRLKLATGKVKKYTKAIKRAEKRLKPTAPAPTVLEPLPINESLPMAAMPPSNGP